MKGIVAIIIFVLIPIVIGFLLWIEYKNEKKILSLFKPGMIIDYYTYSGHGKFRKEKLLISYEILDVDGYYALGKNLDGDKEEELNLKIDMKYSDKMVLREKDGTIVKIFKFEL